MKPSIFYRIFLSQFLLVFIVVSGLLFFSFNILKKHHFETHFRTLRESTACFLPAVSDSLSDGSGLDSLVKKVGKESGIRFTFILPSGRVIADSAEDPVLMDNHLTRPEVVGALRDAKGESLRFSRTVRSKMLYAAVPVIKDGALLGVLRGSLEAGSVLEGLFGIRSRIFLGALFALLASLTGAFFVTGHITEPLKQLDSGAGKISGGDLGFRIRTKRKDEFGRLAEKFNYMAEKVQELFSDLSWKSRQLEGVISSMREGVLLIDGNDIIIKTNESFEEIAGLKPEGKLYWEALRDFNIQNFIKSARQSESPSSAEIYMGGRFFSTSAANLPGGAKMTAVVFNDITKLKNLEKTKKDFVANVSHELKTPLTAIKGFLEAMENEVSPEGMGFLAVISRHTDRLIKIVEDLLVLSSLESEERTLETAPVNLPELIRGVFSLFERKAREKNVELELLEKIEIPEVELDAFRIEQMLINLVENAVNYTNGGKVKAALSLSGNRVVIELSDTGIGIDRKHLKHVFDRFYVADKSRSRRSGGTGLGLSIVKHVVLAHGGEIDVKSEPGEGAAFIISLPLSLS